MNTKISLPQLGFSVGELTIQYRWRGNDGFSAHVIFTPEGELLLDQLPGFPWDWNGRFILSKDFTDHSPENLKQAVGQAVSDLLFRLQPGVVFAYEHLRNLPPTAGFTVLWDGKTYRFEQTEPSVKTGYGDD